jgi:hypothetical protein
MVDAFAAEPVYHAHDALGEGPWIPGADCQACRLKHRPLGHAVARIALKKRPMDDSGKTPVTTG